MKKTALALAAGMLLALAPAGNAAADGETVVSITFDDGYSGTMVGLDAMKARGMKGTLYVNSQRVGYSATFLNRTQLKGYADSGFEIGSHSLDHEDLTLLTPEEAKNNLCADRTNLMDMGFPVTSVAYPFGAQNAAVRQASVDCGFNSGRGIGELKTPSSCLNCTLAETVPPQDLYDLRTPSSVRSVDTLDQLKGLITDVENNGGGWVPLVFHHICDACTDNSITLANFTGLLDWLQTRPATTTIKTVHEVIGGSVKPSPNEPDPVPDADLAVIGSASRTINGINASRVKDSLILYTRVRNSTGTNPYGTEVALDAAGVVTKVEVGVGNMTIPLGGKVLSGHGTSSTWLKNYAKLGTTVVLKSSTVEPPPPTVVYPTTSITVGPDTRAITGTDVYRSSGALIVYTGKLGPTTETNQYGFEAAVVNGVVTKVEDKVGNMAIPDGGYVLSGHGDSRLWLLARVKVGTPVIGS